MTNVQSKISHIASFAQAIALSQEFNKLNSQYGYQSCIQFPAQYDKMDSLQVEIGRLEKEITSDNDISIDGLSKAIENLSIDIDNGEIKPSAQIELYTFNEFVEYIVKQAKMLSKEAERFNDMLHWMQPKDSAHYIETRFILEWENTRDHKKDCYYDDRMSFVIVVDKS